MTKFEEQYIKLIYHILNSGKMREGRNGPVCSTFGYHLKINLENNVAPLLHFRKIHYKGVLGELAALLRKPTKLADFEKWGCNYWKDWADEDGSIRVDYGNAWFEDNQVEKLKYFLLNDPTNRRMIINGWRPGALDSLSLPCCHYSYQFYVRENKFIDMIWNQRSADVAIGIPSDAVLASALLHSIANWAGLRAGKVHMMLGDCHIYKLHEGQICTYLNRAELARDKCKSIRAPYMNVVCEKGKDFVDFVPDDIEVTNYNPLTPISMRVVK